MSTINGIQMIGTQRSGSNLLRVIMDQSPAISSLHPPHILVTFMPLLHLYGPLNDDSNYRQLANDIVDYVKANPVPWEGVVLDADAIVEKSQLNSLFEINKLIYEASAQSKNAKMWCCKSMNNVYYADELEQHGSIQKYIYLYRDGRDVAASFKKAIVGDKHIYFLAKQWKQDQDECLKLRDSLPGNRFFSLNYENLITEPEKTVKRLCDFLNIPYTANMLEYYTSKTSKTTAASGDMWKNLEKPIMHQNTGNFFKSFDPNDLEIFELVAGDTLTRLGYPLYASSANTDLIAADAVEFYRQENIRLKKQSINEAAENDLEKRKPQEEILKSIKNRVTI